MSDDSVRLGCGCGGLILLYAMAGTATLIGTFRLGPIDLGRTIYNQITGDTPILKEQLLDYARRDLRDQYPGFSGHIIDRMLADEMGYELDVETIDSARISIEDLWDASEKHARSWHQKWIWPSLDK